MDSTKTSTYEFFEGILNKMDNAQMKRRTRNLHGVEWQHAQDVIIGFSGPSITVSKDRYSISSKKYNVEFDNIIHLLILAYNRKLGSNISIFNDSICEEIKEAMEKIFKTYEVDHDRW